MLSRTFMFLPGVGPVREARLWRRGVTSWADYRALARVKGVRAHLKERHDELLLLAERARGKDPAFFGHILPSSEHWRAFDDFAHDAAYIDIETTGDRENLITVVGVRHRGENRTFVRDVNYTPDAVSSLLSRASALVTFNGASFDLPVMARDGVQIPQVPHVDLRLVFNRAGHAGGLKKIEERLGLARDDGVQGMTGYDAVKLWRRWERDGDESDLDRLLAYNIADFENLEPLARIACDALSKQMLAEVESQTRLALASAQSS